MDAIRKLQKQLQEAQQVSNLRKISERNCIDLVQKLIASDQVKLFHTTNGKEYLTPEQLDCEILDALNAAGGRVSITDLPNEVGVSLENCEARVEQLRKKDSSLHKLHTELFSQQYLQTVASEVEDSLEEAGSLAVSDLASKYNLPAEYIRSSVLQLVGSSGGTVVKQNTIYNRTYEARSEARTLGALRACTKPVALSQLASRHGLDPDMLTSAAQKFIRDGIICGKIQGATFTPKAFTAAQSGKVDNFFDANGYLTLALAKSSNTTLKEWIQAKSPAGLTLASAFVAQHLVDSVLAAVSDAMNSDSWVDVATLLPPNLPVTDSIELLQQLERQKKLPEHSVLVDRVVLSGKLIKAIANAMEAATKAAAEKAMAKPGGRAKPAEMDDDTSKKKGRSAKGKKKRGGDDDDNADENGGGPAAGVADSGVPNETILDYIAEQHPDLPPELLDEICNRVQVLLVAMVAETVEKLRSSVQTQQRQTFEQAEKLVQERFEQLMLGLKALDSAKLQDTPLYQHLMKEVVLEPLHALIGLRLGEASGNATAVTAANRKQCLDKLSALEGASKTESLSRIAAAFAKGKEVKDVKDGKEVKEVKEKGGKPKKVTKATMQH